MGAWAIADGVGGVLCLVGAGIYYAKDLPGTKIWIVAAVIFLLSAVI